MSKLYSVILERCSSFTTTAICFDAKSSHRYWDLNKHYIHLVNKILSFANARLYQYCSQRRARWQTNSNTEELYNLHVLCIERNIIVKENDFSWS